MEELQRQQKQKECGQVLQPVLTQLVVGTESVAAAETSSGLFVIVTVALVEEVAKVERN